MGDDMDDAEMLAELRRLHEVWVAARDAVLDGRPFHDEIARAPLDYYRAKHFARLLALAEEGLRTRDDVALWQGRYEGAQEENARLRAKVAMGGSALGLAADEAKRMRERVAELEARARCAGCDTLAKPEDECWSCRL